MGFGEGLLGVIELCLCEFSFFFVVKVVVFYFWDIEVFLLNVEFEVWDFDFVGN